MCVEQPCAWRTVLAWTERMKLTCGLLLVVQVYGDPLEHPQTESYWGNVNCIGERSCYDEGKRAAECLTFDYQREHNLEVCPKFLQWKGFLGSHHNRRLCDSVQTTVM